MTMSVKISMLVLLAMCVVSANSICLDGILDMGEECDDGNQVISDGCNTECMLENAMKWLCKDASNQPTMCCPRLEHPITGEARCDCISVEQPPKEEGFTITPACLKRDIDECDNNNGGCFPGAICTNFNVITSLSSRETHVCECTPGKIGDGVTMCDTVDNN
jgi:cysteine-rich repeat protein